MSNAGMREGLKGLRKYLSDQGFYTSVAVLNEAADRIDALERALVTARAALEQWEVACPGCATFHRDGHDATCACDHCPVRQQALTEIAGVGIAGAETAGGQP